MVATLEGYNLVISLKTTGLCSCNVALIQSLAVVRAGAGGGDVMISWGYARRMHMSMNSHGPPSSRPIAF